MLPRQDRFIFDPQVTILKPIPSLFVKRCDLTPEHCIKVLLNELIGYNRKHEAVLENQPRFCGFRATPNDAHEPPVKVEEGAAGVAAHN